MCTWLFGFYYVPLPWRTLVNSFLPFLFVVFIYKDKLLRKLFYYALTIVLGIVSELLATTIVRFIFNINANEVTEAAYRSYCVIAYLVVLIIAYFITTVILRKKILQLSRWEWFFYSLLIAAEIAIICIMLNFLFFHPSSSASVYTVFSIAVLILCIYLIYTLHETSENNSLTLKNEALKNSAEIQYQYYLDLKKQMENISRYRHDIYNHLQTVKSLLESGKNNEAAQYFNELQSEFQKIDKPFRSGNSVIDAILPCKRPIIQEKDIELQCEFDLTEKIAVPDIDLVSVLANLLDNAIEAASLSADKKVSLNCYTKAGMLVIKTSNTYDSGKNTAALKSPLYRHGLGLEIVGETCKRYEGEFHTEKAKEEFLSVACLNIC